MYQTKQNAIQRARISKGLTQEALADRAGYSADSVRAWECGARVASIEALDILATCLDAAWLPQDPVIGQFEQLLGKIVILKTTQGRLIVGALTAWTRTDSAFYTAYRFTLRRVHYEDFTDDANS